MKVSCRFNCKRAILILVRSMLYVLLGTCTAVSRNFSIHISSVLVHAFLVL